MTGGEDLNNTTQFNLAKIEYISSIQQSQEPHLIGTPNQILLTENNPIAEIARFNSQFQDPDRLNQNIVNSEISLIHTESDIDFDSVKH